MENTYIPAKDQDFAQWALNFSTLITANFVAYGLTTGQQSAYATLRSDFITKLATATNPSTRTKPTVAAKNASRALLEASSRSLGNIIQGNPAVTNAQRQDLGLTVRDRNPTPIGPPTTAPIVTPLSTAARNIFFRFADELTPSSRSKPFGAISMQLYAKVDGDAPSSISECNFRGAYTKNTTGPGSRGCQVGFNTDDVGKTAYLMAVWQNRRGEIGPASTVAQMTIAA
jgi:hypothetical protein